MSQNSSLPGLALIGCGGVAAGYRHRYANLPDAEFRLAVDIDGALAERVARELGVARFSTDWRDALSGDIQLVDLSTPNHFHAEQAEALLAAGKHVLIQKPLAPSLDECRRIVRAAEKSRTCAGVYISDLDDPLVSDIRDIVRQGRIGRVTGVRARYAHRGGLSAPRRTDYWRGSAAKTGGGSLMQLSIHHVNLVCWLLSDEIDIVTALSTNLMCENIEGDDVSVCAASLAESGALAVFESSWNADGTSLSLYGSEGSVTIHGCEGAAADVRLNGPFSGRVLTVGESGTGRCERADRTGPDNQHAAFVRAALAGAKAEVPVERGLRDVAVIHAAYLSAREGRRVKVSELL